MTMQNLSEDAELCEVACVLVLDVLGILTENGHRHTTLEFPSCSDFVQEMTRLGEQNSDTELDLMRCEVVLQPADAVEKTGPRRLVVLRVQT